jgi:putative ABC transport system permease protein
MNNGIIQLSIFQLLIAYGLVIVVFALLKVRKIAHQKLLFLATLRMSIQLVLVGYILIYLFDSQNPYLTILIIVIMQAFSLYTILKRFKNQLSKALIKVILITFPIATLSVLFYFLFLIVQITPWFNPQYFIPLSGMIVGNSMTGVILGLSQMIQALNQQRDQIEEALILGAEVTTATKPIIDQSFSNAIIPTLNTMLGMGIVFLPGMMTGQILSGVSPLTAISYQIAIMLGILATVALSVLLVLYFGSKTYFNSQSQLIQKKD